jgi:hypothetical protein
MGVGLGEEEGPLNSFWLSLPPFWAHSFCALVLSPPQPLASFSSFFLVREESVVIPLCLLPFNPCFWRCWLE